MKKGEIDDLRKLKNLLDSSEGEPDPSDKTVFMGLQPIFDHTGKKAKCYEILGREKTGSRFPFMWFAKLDK